MLAGITQQIANANPSMSPAEVTTAAQEHFMQFMQLAAGGDTQAKQQKDNQSKPQETNWLSFLDN